MPKSPNEQTVRVIRAYESVMRRLLKEKNIILTGWQIEDKLNIGVILTISVKHPEPKPELVDKIVCTIDTNTPDSVVRERLKGIVPKFLENHKDLGGLLSQLGLNPHEVMVIRDPRFLLLLPIIEQLDEATIKTILEEAKFAENPDQYLFQRALQIINSKGKNKDSLN